MYFIVASTKSSTGMPHHLPVHMLALRSRHTTSRYFLCANQRTDLADTSSAEPDPAASAVTTADAELPAAVVHSEETLAVADGAPRLLVPPLPLPLLLRRSRVVADALAVAAARLAPCDGGG